MTNVQKNNLTVGSLFSGSGGFELAGAIFGIKPVWNCEIKPFPSLVTAKRFPDTKHYKDVSEMDGSKVEPVDIITFGSPCFPAGIPVLTNKGYKPIESVKAGDMVLTHKNRFKKVLRVGSTPEQNIYELDAQGILPIQATANHPFIVRSKEADGKLSKPYEKPLFMIADGDYIGVPILQTSENPLNITKEEAYLLGDYLGKKYNYINNDINHNDCDALFEKLSDKIKPFGIQEKIHSEILNLPTDYVKAFVEGYFEYGVRKTFCKTSDIEFALNLCLAIQKSFRVGCYICKSKVFSSDKYIVTFNPNQDNYAWFVENNVIWYPIYGVKSLECKENVYNLEIETDHTYVVQNCIVHNCQDLSQAGKRVGLKGSRSCLFHEAIRIIKEMRYKTNDRYPRFVVWENVMGSFTSNKSDDFRVVLESIAKIKNETAKIPMPKSQKWEHSGCIMGDNYSIAWRTLDAQWWGVPQRRRRIFLVADLSGDGASKILFESEGLSGYSPQSGRERQRIAENTEGSFGRNDKCFVNGICVGDYSECNDVIAFNTTPISTVASTLRSQAGAPKHMSDIKGRLCVANTPKGFQYQNSTTAGGVSLCENISPTLSCSKKAAVFMPLAFDGYNSQMSGDVCPTLGVNCGMSTGRCSLLCINDQGGQSINVEKDSISPTLRAQAHGNIPIVFCESCRNAYNGNTFCLQGSMIGRKSKNGPLGSGINENLSFTLNTIDRHAVARNRVVRRFTPIECGRLQGFPDWWCDGLDNPNPTDEEITYWEDVWETYRVTTNEFKNPKTRQQVKKWLQNPYSDEAMYIMWGNGVALPCAMFVMNGVTWYTEVLNEEKKDELSR